MMPAPPHHPLIAPYFSGTVPAGFPSPAGDYEEDRLDLNQLLVTNPPATFFVRAAGDSMVNAGIFPGDLLVVDKSLTPESGQVVIAVIDGEMTLKRLRLHRQNKEISLEPENDDYPVITVSPEADFQIWGVVTHVIHAL